jgi:hypothetical protein
MAMPPTRRTGGKVAFMSGLSVSLITALAVR